MSTQKTANKSNGRFSFRWGIPILDTAQSFVQVYHFMLKNYIRADVTREEFLVIIHLAARHYETPNGQSSPSLETIAREMGYSVRGLQKVLQRLRAKGMMRVIQRSGRTSIYDFQPFAEACLALWSQDRCSQETVDDDRGDEPEFTPELEFTPTPELQFTPPLNSSSPEEEEPKEEPNNRNHRVAEDGSIQGVFFQLLSLGIQRQKAQRLAETYRPEFIEAKRSYYDWEVGRRNGDAPGPGWLVKAIEEDWQPPSAFLKAQEVASLQQVSREDCTPEQDRLPEGFGRGNIVW